MTITLNEKPCAKVRTQNIKQALEFNIIIKRIDRYFTWKNT